jgi:hypothetical protein
MCSRTNAPTDTTVQPKAIAFPTDAKLLHAAIKGLNRLARRHGVQLRQSYLRIAKRAAMLAGRYAHAKQFNRHRRQLRLLRTRLGRIIRDIRRNIGGKADLEAVFEWPLTRANQIRSQQQRGKTRTIRFFRRSTRPTARKWRIVRILNVVDGCIPSDRATSTSEEIEEERRLLYVAMTRAKDELDLIVPHRFFTH